MKTLTIAQAIEALKNVASWAEETAREMERAIQPEPNAETWKGSDLAEDYISQEIGTDELLGKLINIGLAH